MKFLIAAIVLTVLYLVASWHLDARSRRTEGWIELDEQGFTDL